MPSVLLKKKAKTCKKLFINIISTITEFARGRLHNINIILYFTFETLKGPKLLTKDM